MGVPEEHAVTADDRTDVPVRLALTGRLDLDDLRAVIGHQLRGMRPGQEQRQVDDAQPLELHGGRPQVTPAARSAAISSTP
jgi:hypothetical protein